MSSIAKFLRRKLLAGILVVVPLGVTYFVLKLLFNSVDNILAPYIERLLGRDIPGLGLAATIILIFLAGLFGTNVLGRFFLEYIERGLSKIPVVASIYVSAKQIMEAVGTANTKSFKRVVLLEYPRKGLITLGFVTRDPYPVTDREGKTRSVVNIFVPTTPNPTSGFFIISDEADLIKTGMTVEEGIKLVVSGGMIVPPHLIEPEGAPPKPEA